MPEDFRGELIAGTVFVALPTKYLQSRFDGLLGGLLFHHEKNTPGVETGGEATPGTLDHEHAFWARDLKKLDATLELGIKSDEDQRFVEALQSRVK